MELGNVRRSELTHEEGWSYKIESYDDVLEIRYFEGKELMAQISFPVEIADKVLQDAIDLNKKRKEVSSGY